jgi:hypothetical protein
MNVYVVSEVAWRDGAEVIGAATDRAGARAIADRDLDDDSRVAGWTPWKQDPLSESPPTWRRDAMLADGTMHPSLSQEIVCVPLAGSPAAIRSTWSGWSSLT